TGQVAVEVAKGFHERLGMTFWDWGIPTLASLVEVCQSTELSVMASGGIRTGIDAAKAIAVGADAVGVALPLLRQAMEGYDRVDQALMTLIGELKTAMFLTGSASIEELKASSLVITGRTADWLEARGFHPERYAGRTPA
ncbi:MAG: alpha-hydroxy-acid oxidizing protein, partial [Candidatus Bathyarchaeia archaeon]